MPALLLQNVAALINRVVCPADPNRAIGLQNPVAGFYPKVMKSEIIPDAFAFVPVTLIYANPPAMGDGVAVVGEIVWRIGEDQVNRACGDGFQQLQAVAMIETGGSPPL